MSQKRPYADVTARKKAKERDNYTCQICGSTDRTEGHHLFEYSYENGASDPENIITLCHDCHRLVHHGNADITKF